MPNEIPTLITNELTEREQEILRLISTGTSNKEIAHQLSISSNTVKVHVRNIFTKIGVASRTEAAMYAVRKGLVESPVTLEGEKQTQSNLSELENAETPVTSRKQWIVRLLSISILILLLGGAIGGGIYWSSQKASPTSTISLPLASPEPRWHILAALPTARSGMAVVSFEDHIYTIGGDTAQKVTGAAEVYDPTNNSWKSFSSKPIPVSDVNAAVIGGRIFVPGGRMTSGEVTNSLEIYDPGREKWERGSDLPTAMSAYAMVAFEGRLYLFGGWNGKSYFNSVLSYDPSQDKWSELPPMPEARAFAGAAVAGDKIYIVGGYNGKTALATNEIFNPNPEGAKTSWNQAKAMPVGCYDISVGSIAGWIYVIGSYGQSKITASFAPLTNQWQTFEAPPVEIGAGAKMAQLGEYLYIIGGQINKSPTGRALAYQAIYTIQVPVIINTK